MVRKCTHMTTNIHVHVLDKHNVYIHTHTHTHTRMRNVHACTHTCTLIHAHTCTHIRIVSGHWYGGFLDNMGAWHIPRPDDGTVKVSTVGRR